MYIVVEIDTSVSRYGACHFHVPYLHAAKSFFSYEKAFAWASETYDDRARWDILKIGE